MVDTIQGDPMSGLMRNRMIGPMTKEGLDLFNSDGYYLPIRGEPQQENILQSIMRVLGGGEPPKTPYYGLETLNRTPSVRYNMRRYPSQHTNMYTRPTGYETLTTPDEIRKSFDFLRQK